jgi:hypothetical protein
MLCFVSMTLFPFYSSFLALHGVNHWFDLNESQHKKKNVIHEQNGKENKFFLHLTVEFIFACIIISIVTYLILNHGKWRIEYVSDLFLSISSCERNDRTIIYLLISWWLHVIAWYICSGLMKSIFYSSNHANQRLRLYYGSKIKWPLLLFSCFFSTSPHTKKQDA